MKTFRILQITLLLFVAVFMASCEYEFIEIPESAPPPDTTASIISFSQEIAPIFTNDGCTDCHSGANNFDLGPDNAYNSIIDNNLVVAGNPSGSKIYTYPHPVNGTHYKYTSLAEADSIQKWIYQGALNN